MAIASHALDATHGHIARGDGATTGVEAPVTPAALVLSGMSAWLTGALFLSAQPAIPPGLTNAWCGFEPHEGAVVFGDSHCAGCVLVIAGAIAVAVGLLWRSKPNFERRAA
jgi:hypothetical protein